MSTESPPPLRWSAIVAGLVGLVAAFAWGQAPDSLPDGLSPVGARTLGCAWLMAWWWIGSRLPLAIPSLVPLALFPLLGVADSKAIAAPYADRMVLLLLCGFLLALAVEKWGLHKRIALHVLLRAGTSPMALTGGVMLITAGLSMWISNTATTLMMLPIVLALVTAAKQVNDSEADNKRFAAVMVLCLAYAASIGGIATPVGTPPNLIFAGAYSESFPEAAEIDFLAWMRFGVPVSLVMGVLAWWMLNKVLLPVPKGYRLGDRAALRDQLVGLGPMSWAEVSVAVGFAVTAALWVLRKPLGLPSAVHDSTIGAFMVIVFFLLPATRERGARRLLEWGDAARVPWGLLLLFGGGIALSTGFKTSGLTTWLAAELAPLAGLPTPLMIAGLCLVVTFLTELTSNTATTALLMPVLAATATATDTSPLLLMVPATLAASCAFMLPVATAPNAIVIGSAAVDQATMARTGLWLNLAGVVPITAVVWLLGAG